MTKVQTLSHYSSQLEIARLMEENERLKQKCDELAAALRLALETTTHRPIGIGLSAFAVTGQECAPGLAFTYPAWVSAARAALMGEKK